MGLYNYQAEREGQVSNNLIVALKAIYEFY